ncbi:MAG: mandelate racemase/muconate lactonizing enzyme family protein [bacterium]
MKASLHPFRAPLGLATADGTLAWRAGHWIEAGGGVGEIVAWPGFGSGPAAVQAALARPLPGAPIAEVDDLTRLPPLLPEIRHGLSLALLDGLARRRGLPLARLLHEDAPLWAPTHVQVADAAEARAATRQGATALKVKIGGAPLAAERRRLSAIREAAGPAARLRLDANGRLADPDAWLHALADLDVEWWEQPAPVGAPLPAAAAVLALDEAIQTAADVDAAAAAGVAVVVLKPAFLGGLLAARDLARHAASRGLRVCLTHGFESAVGRAGAAHLAAAMVPELPDLAGGLLPPGPAPLDAGRLHLADRPGHGGWP